MTFECEVCFEPFNTTVKRPLVGSCGHTYCQSCTTHFKKSTCPECRQELSFEKSATNFTILRMLPSIPEPAEAHISEPKGESQPVSAVPGGAKSSQVLPNQNVARLSHQYQTPPSYERTNLWNRARELSLRLNSRTTNLGQSSSDRIYDFSGTQTIIRNHIEGSGRPDLAFSTSVRLEEFLRCFNGYELVMSMFRGEMPNDRPLVFSEFSRSISSWTALIVCRTNTSNCD